MKPLNIHSVSCEGSRKPPPPKEKKKPAWENSEVYVFLGSAFTLSFLSTEYGSHCFLVDKVTDLGSDLHLETLTTHLRQKLKLVF